MHAIDPLPVKRVYITRDVDDRRSESGDELLQRALGHYGMEQVTSIDDADAMIVIGGDGAFLQAAREHNFAAIPIAGISTGTLGYFMSTPPDQESVDYLVRNLAEGDYQVHSLPLLELRDIGGTVLRLAANDIVIKANGFQAFKAGLQISGTPFEHFVGSGIAFSTPQGSSGEGLANGGSFIREGLPVWTITPKSIHPSKEYHSLVAPMVLGVEDDVTLEIKEAFKRPFMIGADGRPVNDWPADDTTLRVSLSKDKSIHRIRLNNNTYLQDVARIFRGTRS